MPIAKDNIKLMKSQRMTDNTDGGGRITGNQTQDHLSNEIFDDITDLDRVTGNVSLRKIYPWVDTTDTEGYFGSNIILANTPEDENVSITMMKTGDFDDERDAARDKIERYLVKSTESDYGLLGDHFAGQRSLNWFAILQRDPPSPGETYVIESDDGAQQEYIRLIDVTATVQDFVYLENNVAKTYEAWNIIAEISAPLANDYTGGVASQVGLESVDGQNLAAGIYTTQVADAARYYGIKPLTSAATIGDSKVYVDDLFANIVPAGTAEQPITDDVALKVRTFNRAVSKQPISATNEAWQPSGESIPRPIYLPTPIVPGTLTITVESTTFQDLSNNGNLSRTDGGSYVDNATVDYDTGIVTVTANFSGGGGQFISFNYMPGAPADGTVVSTSEYITPVNRGFNYSVAYPQDPPARGTTRISYMVFGEWYEIIDNGEGQLVGRGSGTVNYDTGTIQVTLQELPDVDSYIIYNFVPLHPDNIADLTGTNPNPLKYTIETTDNDHVAPGTASIEYTSDSTTYTVTDDGQGELTGDGVGTIDYGNGVATFQPTRIPDDGTDITFDYDTSTFVIDTILNANITRKGTQAGTLTPGTGITHFSIVYTTSLRPEAWGGSSDSDSIPFDVVIASDGAGGCKYSVNRGDWITLPNSTLNLTTGEYAIKWPIYGLQVRAWNRSDVSPRTFNVRLWPNDPNLDLDVRYRYNDSTSSVGTTTTGATSAASLTLPVENLQGLIKGSLAFDWLDERYYDDGQGNLLTQFNYADGTGTIVGAVNYGTGGITINTWNQTPGLQSDLVIVSGGGVANNPQIEAAVFRTAGAPIRSGSFQMQATSNDDGVANPIVSVTADGSGAIDTGDGAIVGTINYETGTVSVDFDPIVDPFSILYNAVQTVFLPLDAEIVGIDPVRLPQDGRVPIYRTGDVAVVHNEQDVEITTPAADQAIDVGRTRLTEVRLYDVAGNAIPSNQFTADLDAGIVTLANPIDTVTYTAPWVVTHRVEDMALINDVDISGEVSLTRQISHQFDSGTSFLSTALIMGDLQARVTNVFDQETWTNEWSDELIGTEPAAEYDNATYPLEVDNRGALYQRWALVFTGSTSFNIVGETVGTIGVGNTNADIGPINPNTSTPYFTIRSAGWGSGWSAGNVLRFTTVSSNYPVWVARSVSQSNPTDQPDQFRLQVRGNINT